MMSRVPGWRAQGTWATVDQLGDDDFIEFDLQLLRERSYLDGAQWQASKDLSEDCRLARSRYDRDARARVAAAVNRRMPRDARQASVLAWAKAAFTAEQATSLPQRGLRLLEEATEAFQACGGDAQSAHRLVDYVFGRPVGEVGQELGGVGVTLLALAAAAGLSAEDEEVREVERVLARPLEEFARRNRAKNDAGLLLLTPAAPATTTSVALDPSVAPGDVGEGDVGEEAQAIVGRIAAENMPPSTTKRRLAPSGGHGVDGAHPRSCRCGGRGWLWGHQLRHDAEYVTDNRYQCDADVDDATDEDG
jgi:NTP pyrophosphatase (non-canonical NTP hydrolase)